MKKGKPEIAGPKLDTKFKKGISGNVKGKPKGCLNQSTMMALALLKSESQAMVRVVVDKALSGDMQALSLCLSRLIPQAKDAPFDCVLPKVETIADLPKITAGLLDAVSSGNMGPSEAEKIVKIVSGHIQALQLSEFETRLTELENTAGLKKGGGR